MSIKISRRDVETRFTRHPCLLARLLSNPASEEQETLAISTDIPPQRALHAKAAPYPSGRKAGVYRQLGGYEDGHGPPAALTHAHLCAGKLRLLEVPEKFPPPPPHPHLPDPPTFLAVPSSLQLRERMTRGSKSPTKSSSRSPRRTGGGNPSSRGCSSLPPLHPPWLTPSLPHALTDSSYPTVDIVGNFDTH